jgi:PAS domain S-box-containing protein
MSVPEVLPVPQKGWILSALIAILTIAIFIVSVISLLAGWQTIFQNLFYFPIILACVYYVKRGFVFSVIVACGYFVLMAIFSKDPVVLEGALIRVLIFILVAGVITYLSITRIRAEDALKGAEKKYRLLIENSHDIIFTLNTEGVFTFVSPSWNRLLGHEVTWVIGKSFSQFVHPDDIAQCLAFMHSVFGTGQRQTSIEYRVKHLDGSWRWHATNAVPLWDENGTIIGGEGSASDITDRKMAEDSLAHVNRKLKLLSSITRHDILNQLTVLVGQLELLERKQPDRSFDNYFNRIFGAAERIQAMIRFTKTYESIGINAPAWQDVHSLVETASKEAPVGDVMVINDIPAGAAVFADPLIIKVFYNLMENAVRYGEKISTIRFSIEESGNDLLIICEDDGVGIPVEEKEKIFERRFGKNTGMGLFLSREILSITGITIKETGESAKGARFAIFVPMGAFRVMPV